MSNARKNVEAMSLDEKVDEILTFTRAIEDLLEAASSNPMLAMMMPKGLV